MDTKGNHLTLDIWMKDNVEFRKLKNILANTLMKHKQLILGFQEWEFYPRGESGIFLIATSHCSVHTYPENKYITVDVYSCDPSFNPIEFETDLLNLLPWEHYKQKIVVRGIKE